jgi:hypothetical protein
MRSPGEIAFRPMACDSAGSRKSLAWHEQFWYFAFFLAVGRLVPRVEL